MIKALERGNYYPIYNRGINSCTLFKEKDNYEHFLKLFKTHIEPIAETFAWCLMKNHFHFLVRIKEIAEINSEKLFYPHNLSLIYSMLILKLSIKNTIVMVLCLKDHFKENRYTLILIFKM
jgi:hypothetical protein